VENTAHYSSAGKLADGSTFSNCRHSAKKLLIQNVVTTRQNVYGIISVTNFTAIISFSHSVRFYDADSVA